MYFATFTTTHFIRIHYILYVLYCETYKDICSLDHLHQTESAEKLLHAPKLGDVAAAGEGHATSGLSGSLRQDVLPIRGQGVHEAGSREATVARCASSYTFFLSPSYFLFLFFSFFLSRGTSGLHDIPPRVFRNTTTLRDFHSFVKKTH